MKGIDVSHWQGEIDFGKVASTSTKFVIIKATQGTGYVDPKFAQNKSRARAAGLLVGYYHFADGGDAKKEAQHFVNKVGDIKAGELLVLDWEIGHVDPVGWSKTFLDEVTRIAGFKPLFYTNSARLYQYNWSPVIGGNYGLWVAQYGLNLPIVSGSPRIGGWPFYALWQYTSRGSVNGINGYVDMNYTSMTLDTLKKYGKQEAQCNHSCPKCCQ